MYQIHHSFDVLHRRMLQDAVSQIKDMTRSALRAMENIVNPFLDLWQRGKQDCRIQVTLYGAIVSDDSPAFIERQAPIQAEHRAAGTLHERQQCCAIRPKMDDRHVHRFGSLEDLLRIRQDEGFIVSWTERADP